MSGHQPHEEEEGLLHGVGRFGDKDSSTVRESAAPAQGGARLAQHPVPDATPRLLQFPGQESVCVC